MSEDIDGLNVPLVTRIEGHSKVDIDVKDKKVQDVEMNVIQGPRYFEKILEGKKYTEVSNIVARICSICPGTHNIDSIRALENAMNVDVPEYITELRDLYMMGEWMESHALHSYFLVLPDFLGYPDAISAADDYPEEVEDGLFLKKTGNMIHELVSGRDIHGANGVVGGFGRIPRKREFKKVKQRLRESLEKSEETVDLFADIEMPDWPSFETTHMAADPGDTYSAMTDDMKIYDEDKSIMPDEWYSTINEVTVKHSTVKHAFYDSKPFITTALSRLLLYGDRLHGKAKAAYERYKDKLDEKNVMTNNFAQTIELLYATERAFELIDSLLGKEVWNEDPSVDYDVQAGRGASFSEAPRGTLYHEYEVDDDGLIVDGNIMAPTTMNSAHMERDLRIAAEGMLRDGMDKEEIEKKLEWVIRAYDPCITCSVHMVNLNFD